MRFKDKKQRYQWMLENSPKMVEDLSKFKAAFGEIKLSNVGPNNEVGNNGSSNRKD